MKEKELEQLLTRLWYLRDNEPSSAEIEQIGKTITDAFMVEFRKADSTGAIQFLKQTIKIMKRHPESKQRPGCNYSA